MVTNTGTCKKDFNMNHNIRKDVKPNLKNYFFLN